MSKIQPEVSAQDKSRQRLIEVLKETQNRLGYLSRDSLVEIAHSFGLPLNEVYGVATFYSFLDIKPKGRNVIRICKSLPCHLKDSHTIIEGLEKELGVKPGETTPDGRFSFELTNCIGACDKAPAMMVNCDVHGDLTPERIVQILEQYK